MIIHSAVMPRKLRVESAAGTSTLSWEEDLDIETLCQNSDVAI
jgi:hypothetical protein